MAGWSDRQTWHERDVQARWIDLTNAQLRAIIARERVAGRAFGVVAEAARHELARRGERE